MGTCNFHPQGWCNDTDCLQSGPCKHNPAVIRERLTKHIEERLAKSKQDSPTIAVSRIGWATIVAALRAVGPRSTS